MNLNETAFNLQTAAARVPTQLQDAELFSLVVYTFRYKPSEKKLYNVVWFHYFSKMRLYIIQH